MLPKKITLGNSNGLSFSRLFQVLNVIYENNENVQIIQGDPKHLNEDNTESEIDSEDEMPAKEFNKHFLFKKKTGRTERILKDLLFPLTDGPKTDSNEDLEFFNLLKRLQLNFYYKGQGNHFIFIEKTKKFWGKIH